VIFDQASWHCLAGGWHRVTQARDHETVTGSVSSRGVTKRWHWQREDQCKHTDNVSANVKWMCLQCAAVRHHSRNMSDAQNEVNQSGRSQQTDRWVVTGQTV